jgi:diaminohydroxyphosphoribosylaminopyrimidine deaminase/5-amino-6-(5-phosphoribosylamino)uracil reductase
LAFSVGALLVSATGELIAAGYSRQADPADHAEEVALAEAARVALGAAPGTAEDLAGAQVQAGDVASWLTGATLYTSLEPCLRRKSRPHPCADLIVSAGVGRVVLAWREPPLFMPGGGVEWLRRAGVEVTEIPDLAGAARAVNAHLPAG